MRVLSVIITPPMYRASGGVSAGLKLAEHLATLCDMEAAIMADRSGTSTQGTLRIRQFACTNRLGPLRRLAPRQLIASLWRSDIPRYIAETRPDIVHLHNPFPPLALREAANACRRLDIPYVISSHGFVELGGYAAAYNLRFPASVAAKILVERPFAQVVHAADRVFILSPLERGIMAQFGVPESKQVVVTNGVDGEFATNVSDEVRSRLATRLTWPADVTNLLFVGNLTFNKGLDVLLAAMNLVKAKARLVVAGALRSTEQASELLREAGLPQDDPRVIFTDHVTYDELRALHQRSDIFVFPSRADTLPLVILEAMVTGIPVIASNVGGIPFQVTPECGIIVLSGDAGALAAAIDTLAADAPRRRAMGHAARARVTAHFSWSESALVAMRAYEDLLQSRGGGVSRA